MLYLFAFIVQNIFIGAALAIVGNLLISISMNIQVKRKDFRPGYILLYTCILGCCCSKFKIVNYLFKISPTLLTQKIIIKWIWNNFKSCFLFQNKLCIFRICRFLDQASGHFPCRKHLLSFVFICQGKRMKS